jgi:type II secretory pathway pseudopilin PulG
MSAVEMQADRSPAAVRAPRNWCAGVLARARSERGDTLIEVVIGALMVALIAAATLGGFADIGHLAQTQRSEEQATALAQQDQARLRGLSLGQLSSNGLGTGNVTTQTQVDNTIYSVASKSQFISGTTGSAACTGTGNADEVQTTSTVTWSGAQGTRNPVVVHGEITPNEGGSIVASVEDPTGAGLAGVTISASGPTATSPVITDSSGCVVWAGLSSGTYTISYTPPAGTWITTAGTAPASQTVTVTATQTMHATLVQIGQASAVQANFTTTYNGSTVPGTSDTFVLSSTGMTPSPQVFGQRRRTRRRASRSPPARRRRSRSPSPP